MVHEKSASASHRKPPRRRFLQFGIGSLLLVVTVVSVWLGWLTNSANRQRRAVDLLKRDGASVNFGYSSDVEPPGPRWLRTLVGDDCFRTAKSVSFCARPITSEMLQQIHELKELEELSLFTCQLDDDGMRHLAGLRRLQHVHLQKNKITDSGMRHLAASMNLETLSLSDNRVGNAGLAYLKDSKKLRALFLCGNPAGDEGLKHIANLPKLEWLRLARTKITDEGLRHLAGLKNLKYVDLGDNKLSPEALHRLREALPNCKVEYFVP